MAIAVKHTMQKDVLSSCCLNNMTFLCIFSITVQPSYGPCMVLSFATRASPEANRTAAAMRYAVRCDDGLERCKDRWQIASLEITLSKLVSAKTKH